MEGYPQSSLSGTAYGFETPSMFAGYSLQRVLSHFSGDVPKCEAWCNLAD